MRAENKKRIGIEDETARLERETLLRWLAGNVPGSMLRPLPCVKKAGSPTPGVVAFPTAKGFHGGEKTPQFSAGLAICF